MNSVIFLSGPADSGKTAWCKRHGIPEYNLDQLTQALSLKRQFGTLIIAISSSVMAGPKIEKAFEDEGWIVSYRIHRKLPQS